MSYQKYNVAIIPSEDVLEQAIQVSQQLAEHDAFFILNTENVLPHVSLYHVALFHDKVSEAISVLEGLFESAFPVEMIQDEYDCVEGGWIDMSYQKTKALCDLHFRTIKVMQDVWDRDVLEQFHDFSELSPEKQQVIQKYGWPASDLFFRPHLTLSRLQNEDCLSDVLREIPSRNFCGKYWLVCIGGAWCLHKTGPHV
ncbi:MAG: hypothetical protein KC736_01645 [Candidatus Moranbacteria bacterium]|nr:hypothetical protein [Candidatus Moranbacteria bacterium]